MCDLFWDHGQGPKHPKLGLRAVPVQYGLDGPVPVPLSIWLTNWTDGRRDGITRLTPSNVRPSRRWTALDGFTFSATCLDCTTSSPSSYGTSPFSSSRQPATHRTRTIRRPDRLGFAIEHYH